MKKFVKPDVKSFTSLAWYDEIIEFVFRFVAKTSEPLLALGLVISAADFLTKGTLMHSNPELTLAWAWTQAIAIEASSGVVFVYALQSFKAKDKVKAWLYLVLSLLLALTGGAMLLFQLVANTTGLQESTLPTYLFYSFASLRVVVSVAYVYLCRAKHIRFTDLEDETPMKQSETGQGLSDEITQLILSKLAKLDQLEQAMFAMQNTTVIETETPPALLETGETVSETEAIEPVLEAQVSALLILKPDVSSREAAQIVGKSHTTVYRALQKVKQSETEVKQ